MKLPPGARCLLSLALIRRSIIYEENREERKELMEMIYLLPPKYWFRGMLLVSDLIADVARLGAYLINTPTRETLDKKRRGTKLGMKSGQVRAERSAKKWQDKAVVLAEEIRERRPQLSTRVIAEKVEEQWGGKLPIGFRRLYEFLCEHFRK